MVWLLPLVVTIFARLSQAAELQFAPHELWSGRYRCSAMLDNPEAYPAYTAAVRLTLDDGHAHITKESARIRETLSGKVSEDGALKLEGAGSYKSEDGPTWRYSFEGRFEGATFNAKGVMLGARKGTTLRECTMELTRLSTSRRSRRQAAPDVIESERVDAAKESRVAVSESKPPPDATPMPRVAPPMHQSEKPAPPPAEQAAPVVPMPSPPGWTPPAPSAVAPEIPQQVDQSSEAQPGLPATRAELVARLESWRAQAELAASGKAAAQTARTRQGGQSAVAASAPAIAGRSIPSAESQSVTALDRAAHTSGLGSATLWAVLCAVGLTGVAAFATRKRWFYRVTQAHVERVRKRRLADPAKQVAAVPPETVSQSASEKRESTRTRRGQANKGRGRRRSR